MFKPCPFCGLRKPVLGATNHEIDEPDPDDLAERTEYTVCCDVLMGGFVPTSGYEPTEAVSADDAEVTF